eukprot:gene10723-7633_t
MHLSEKISLMHGVLGTYTGNIPAVDRLNIPSINMQDGPQGFRAMDKTGGEGSSTAWPSSMTLAASWDEDLLGRWATALAQEFVGKGANMLLGPGIGIARVPTAGRNFEYLCGEDPVLGSVLVKPVVRNIQEQGILADAKHFVNNEIETHRMLVSANVDERTRFEIYYRPFQAAVDAGVLTIMCSYNRINDVYACQNEETLSHLRDILGFEGWIVSDWTATKSTVKSLKAGMDVEMPNGLFYNRLTLEKKLIDGDIDMKDIDTSHVNGPYVITPAQGIANALAGAGVTATKVLYNDGQDVNAAADLAKQCSVAVVVVATTSSEGSDRETLALSGNQDALIASVASANPKTIVSMNIPGAILMPWLDQVPAVLASWMPGQEAGNALADVLFGKVNPSARLPVTMPNKDNEVGFTRSEFPGTGIPPEANYDETLLIGYRWYDAYNVTPRFPFGHGLSYTTFAYSQLQLTPLSAKAEVLPSNRIEVRSLPVVSLRFLVRNAGKVDGDEITQVYLAYPAAANEPPRQLRAFKKVSIPAGNHQEVTLSLKKDDCAVWNTEKDAWEILAGEYTVFVGASSRDLRLQATFTVN